MRLFIAINFNEKVKLRLAELSNGLRAGSTKGRFVPPENLHLTLVFLGECDEKQALDAKSAMDAVEFKAFKINIDNIGRFKRRGGDIWWAGIRSNKELTRVYEKLTKNLTESGFQIEKRKFSPHITLGREIITNISPHTIEEFGQQIDKIELMKSERIAGKIVYTTIYENKSH